MRLFLQEQSDLGPHCLSMKLEEQSDLGPECLSMRLQIFQWTTKSYIL